MQEFLKGDFLDALKEDDLEVRLQHSDAALNTSTRIYEWLTSRHALLQVRSRVQTEGHSAELLAHIQEMVYAEVGQDPPASSWVTQISDTFQSQVGVAKRKVMAQRAAASADKKGDSAGARPTTPGQDKNVQLLKLKKFRPKKDDQTQ